MNENESFKPNRREGEVMEGLCNTAKCKQCGALKATLLTKQSALIIGETQLL